MTPSTGITSLLALMALSQLTSFTASAACSQTSLDSMIPPSRTYSFRPRVPLVGFYQWANNNGYCGEVSLLQSGLALGQWISQFNARSIASAYASNIAQTGSPYEGRIEFLSQLLLDDFMPPGYANANNFGTAAANMKLNATAFKSSLQQSGTLGYQAFMTWVKAEVIKGNFVTLGVIDPYGSGPYSHIVNVVGVDSNNPASNTAYNGADVLIIEDHGLLNLDGPNPAVPPGAGSTSGCTPYRFAYTFDSLKGAPSKTGRRYQIPVPGTPLSPKSYATSVSGVADTQGVTLPVSLTMATTLPVDPIIGQRYEAPFIGTSIYGGSFTNRKPAAMQVTLTATVSGLTIGRAYVLYQYKTSTSPLPKGPLAVPSANFNANAAMASATTRFTASGTTYTARVSVLSSDTVVFRCVPATAP